MKKLLLYTFLCLPLFGWTQSKMDINSAKDLEPLKSTKVLAAELAGTFEVEISQPNYQILYTSALFEQIEARRKDNEEVRFVWDSYTTIIIHPRNAIQGNSSPMNKN